MAFGITIASTVPGAFNIISVFGGPLDLVVAGLDVIMGLAVGVLLILTSVGTIGAAAQTGPGRPRRPASMPRGRSRCTPNPRPPYRA